MVNEKRNANVVAMLVASLTVGAGLLLVLDPHPKTAAQGTMLAAMRGERVDSLLIEWAETGTTVMLENALTIDAAGNVGGATAGHGRLVVFSPKGELSDNQKQVLLGLLMDLGRECGLLDRNVRIDERCHPTHNAELAGGARDLFNLLHKKAFVGKGG